MKMAKLAILGVGLLAAAVWGGAAAIAADAATAAAPAHAAAATRTAIRLVALDVGGTLIEDHGEVPSCMQAALGAKGIAASLAEINDWRGASKRSMVQHFVELRVKTAGDKTTLIDTIYNDFNARADTAYVHVKPIPGAEKCVAELRRMGLLVATTTGFGRELNDTIFRRLGWHDLFHATSTSDEVADGRPAPYMLFHVMEATKVENVAETVAVGDTPLDLQAANNARVAGVIGVLSGAGTRERMEREEHTHMLPSVAELPALLRTF